MSSEITSLAGKLLLAHPCLRDSNFRRSIVYLASHDLLSGAFGFIINRRTRQTCASLGLSGLPDTFHDTQLHLGGPVGSDTLLFATIQWDAARQQSDIAYSTDPALLDPHDTLALIGYAGWSPGQLETEIQQDSWLVLNTAEAGPQIRHADHTTWKNLVGRIHPHLKLLAETPDDPALN